MGRLLIDIECHAKESSLKKLLEVIVVNMYFQECLRCVETLERDFGDMHLEMSYNDQGIMSRFKWREHPLGEFSAELREGDPVNALCKFVGLNSGISIISVQLLRSKLLGELKPLIHNEVVRFACLYAKAGGDDLQKKVELLKPAIEDFHNAVERVLNP